MYTILAQKPASFYVGTWDALGKQKPLGRFRGEEYSVVSGVLQASYRLTEPVA